MESGIKELMKNQFKIAHFVVFAPNRCGLYHTTKDLILAERQAGLDARMIALENESLKPLPPQDDKGFKTEIIDWSVHSDVLVRHSVIPTQIQSMGIPVIMAMHGRPESGVRLQVKDDKKHPIIRIFAEKIEDERHKAFVYFWPEYGDIWKQIIPADKLFYVPAIVNLDDYVPTDKASPWTYPGHPNIVIADVWREDIIPFNILFAAAKFAEKYKQTRIHMVGCQAEYQKVIMPFLKTLKKKGVLGYVSGQIKEIKDVYGGADLVITPHKIATRIIRESLASNIPVVASIGCKYTPYTGNPNDIDDFASAIERCWADPIEDYCPRDDAEKYFGFDAAGEAMKKVVTAVLKRHDNRRKIFIDIGCHHGESVRRFYQDVPDAREYEIYSFEPDVRNIEVTDSFLFAMHNLNLINACAGRFDGMTDFYRGNERDNEGGTTQPNKITGRIDYQKPSRVLSIDIVRWLKEHVSPGDHVIMKVNIEGGEYDLMEYLLEEEVTSMIHKIYVQLHAHKFPHGRQRQRYQNIEARFWNEAKCFMDMDNSGHHRFRN